MKKIIGNIAIATAMLIACNSNSKSTESVASTRDTTSASNISSNARDSGKTALLNDIVNSYLQMKNAFVADNSADVALAGTIIENAFKNFNTGTLTDAQKKTFDDIADDAKENAEHISKNSGNIAHQREHFEMLSNDMYDLAKAIGGGQILYKEFCPVYNNHKGAFWLSETKEIKNPYLGKAMPTCGTVIEEIK